MDNIVKIVAFLVFLGFCYYWYMTKKQKKTIDINLLRNLKVELKPEMVEALSLGDVISYFKGLQLKKEKDIPFICNAQKNENLINFQSNATYCYLIATYNEETNEIENYKLLETNKVDSQLLNVIANEKLVVLS